MWSNSWLNCIIAVLISSSASNPLFAADLTDKQPNILFILSDDHALEAIGAYDSWLNNYLQTPTIDGLAAEGMR